MATLKAELDSHRRIGRQLQNIVEPTAGDPLRETLVQARGDAFDIGVYMGGTVAARWFLGRARELLDDQALRVLSDGVHEDVLELVRS